MFELSRRPKQGADMTTIKPIEQENNTNKREIVSRAKLLEAGVYFGHKKSMWNPKMEPYLRAMDTNNSFPKRNIHLIDITKTKKTLEFAYSLVEKFTAKGATFIFVGTRNRAKETIKHNALRTNSFYVSERWLGGTLTNWKTISEGVKKMFELEKMAENNFEGYTKKEGVLFTKQLAKYHRNFSGIKNMRTKPNVMIVADPKHDYIAVKEARKSGIKVIGIVDSNSDPTSVDVAIPANDDSTKSLTLIITILADAIAKVKGGKQEFAFQADEDIVLPEDKKDPSKNFSRDRNFKNSDQRRSVRPSFSRVRDDQKEDNEKQETKEASKIISKPLNEFVINKPTKPEANVDLKSVDNKNNDEESNL